jgi:lysine 2,3-aminomutase
MRGGTVGANNYSPLHLITTIEGLPPALASTLSPTERTYTSELQKQGLLPFAVTPFFASLACPDSGDPIRRQFFPDPREALPDPLALSDPLGEAHYRINSRLVHQYQDRALLLATGTCFGYCRHCFRRVWLGTRLPFIDTQDPAQTRPITGYLKAHPEIREVLVSGGDPLTADDGCLAPLFDLLRSAREGVLIRLCTRAPITNPARLAPETIAMLRQYRPLRMVVHINHPRELADPARTRLATCVEAGIPVHIQTVLLRGINDDPAILAELFRACLDLGLSPYYLFQLDLAPGTRHFRVPLKEGLGIYRQLKALISGLGLPRYAVDLPGGGGKILLDEGVIAGEQGDVYLLKDLAGRLWPYPIV